MHTLCRSNSEKNIYIHIQSPKMPGIVAEQNNHQNSSMAN